MEAKPQSSPVGRGAAGIIFVVVLLGAVGYFAADGRPATGSIPAPSPLSGVASDQALPFAIEGAWLSDMFKDNLKVAKVQVGIDGGDPRQWAATMIVIAEAVASYGANSVEVSLRRSDIKQQRGDRFREVAHAYYSPDPSHAVWPNQKSWEIYTADPERLSTQTDVTISEEFAALNEKYIASGMDPERADARAGAAIAKKYKLQKDWTLPIGNVVVTGAPRSKEAFNVNPAAAQSSLAALSRCMKGKILRTEVRCDQAA